MDDAVKYLQTRKAAQRKHCKLLYTHSKEEISTIIKNVNSKIQEAESSDEDSSSDEYDKISLKRYSELGKDEPKPKPKPEPSLREDLSPSPVRSPPPSGSKPKLSAPNVPPGTSVNVNSFSLVR